MVFAGNWLYGIDESHFINAMARGRQSRRWCFTLNNFSGGELDHLRSDSTESCFSFICFGKEVSGTGTPHLQGYFELKRKKTLGGCKRIDGLSRAHLEIAKGSATDNLEYCKKDGDFFRRGEPMDDLGGSHSRLERIKVAIDGGATMRDIADLDFGSFCQYRRSFESYMSMVHRERSWKTVVVVLYGGTGTGKTKFVNDMVDDRRTWWWGGEGAWFDGYDGHEVAVFDDYSGQLEAGRGNGDRGVIPFRRLLRLLDRYPERVPIKGGQKNWAPRKIYFTSNDHPCSWYPSNDWATLERRIEVIHELI